MSRIWNEYFLAIVIYKYITYNTRDDLNNYIDFFLDKAFELQGNNV